MEHGSFQARIKLLDLVSRFRPLSLLQLLQEKVCVHTLHRQPGACFPWSGDGPGDRSPGALRVTCAAGNRPTTLLIYHSFRSGGPALLDTPLPGLLRSLAAYSAFGEWKM